MASTYCEFCPTVCVVDESSSIAAVVIETLSACASADCATLSMVAISSSCADVVCSIEAAWFCDSISTFLLTSARSSAFLFNSSVAFNASHYLPNGYDHVIDDLNKLVDFVAD